MSRALSDFDANGVAFPISVLDAGELRTAQEAYARLVETHDGQLTRADRLHLIHGWAYDLTTHPRVVDAVASLLGDDVIVWGTLLLCKPPHDEEFVAWHQDSAYAGYLAEAQAVSAWLALSDSTTENGCMRVIPGSHRTKLHHVEAHRPRNMLSRGQEIEVDVDESHAVDIELRAGQMSIHHIDIVHGSGPNRSSAWRSGFIIRYTTPQIAECPIPLTVARGRVAAHLNVVHERPGGA
jgi:non-heme Fe2+,alpha-ketoglutarate-dependent halogenase